MRIIFTPEEIEMAERYAIGRRAVNREFGTTDQAYIKGETADLVGVKGEMAASLATGIPWLNRCTTKEEMGGWPRTKMPDLGTDIEVRTIRKSWYNLNVLEHNPDEWRYVLTFLVAPDTVDVLGWQHGEAIKQTEYWREYTKKFHTYSYPQNLLRPIGKLKE